MDLSRSDIKLPAEKLPILMAEIVQSVQAKYDEVHPVNLQNIKKFYLRKIGFAVLLGI